MQMAAVMPMYLPASMTPPLPPSNAPPPPPLRRPSRRRRRRSCQRLHGSGRDGRRGPSGPAVAAAQQMSPLPPPRRLPPRRLLPWPRPRPFRSTEAMAAAQAAAVAGLSAAACPRPSPPWGFQQLLCRPPFHAASAREPFMQCSSCRLPSAQAAEMAWIWDSCLQSRFLPGHTGVQRVVSGGILASENHP